MKTWFILIPLIALITMMLSFTAQADTYHRFWRGVKRADLSWDGFSTSLNQVFIPATVKTGAGNGMIAYEPVLTQGREGLPDEVALVSYADQAAYNALYSTDFGKAYQNLHWQYFDRASSHSVVPESYIGKVELEHAYDLFPKYAEWMKNETTVLVSFRKTNETDSEYLERAKNHLEEVRKNDDQRGIQDRVVLVSKDYALEYVSANPGVQVRSDTDLVFEVENAAPGDAQIVSGSGVNLRF